MKDTKKKMEPKQIHTQTVATCEPSSMELYAFRTEFT